MSNTWHVLGFRSMQESKDKSNVEKSKVDYYIKISKFIWKAQEEMKYVWSVLAGIRMKRIWAHDIREEKGEKHIPNTVNLLKKDRLNTPTTYVGNVGQEKVAST
ncbi:hypothetical protein V6N12_033848 [Hibiscus sabdariffa]|uniref:Uncharacterized protein n=1 Tax=Hibiscus sabdariffa TaxID=183260 RepID=A0ABR1ZGA8_9ROSI